MSDWRWQSAKYLNLLWLVPVIYFLFRVWLKRSQNLIANKLGKKTAPLLVASVSNNKRLWKERLQLLALTLMIVAYARPQSSTGSEKVKNEGIEIMFLVDVSNSMLAEDMKPSRLEFAKSELDRFVDMSGGDRMGVIAFAGSPALLSPLTTDQDAVKLYLDSLTTDSVSTQGTDFEKALDEAHDAFKRGGLGDQDGAQVTRAIVILSDGEDHEPGALDAAKELVKEGIHIYAIGFGTKDGAPIPIRDDNGQLRGYKRDHNGQVVITKFTGKELRALAQAGDGAFYQANYESDAMRAVRGEIDKLRKSQFKSGEIQIYGEYYQVPLFCALMIAILEIWLGERRGPGRLWRGRFEVMRD